MDNSSNTNVNKVESLGGSFSRGTSEFLDEKLAQCIKPKAFQIKTVPPVDMTLFGRELLKSHNAYRKIHGAPPLSLSDELSKVASQWAGEIADRDRMEHSSSSNYGENIYFCNGFTPTGSGVTESWYNEVAKYDYEASQFSSGTGHFTAVVWAATKRLGFGVGKSKEGNYYVVANYEPAGNVRGAFKENVLPYNTNAEKRTVPEGGLVPKLKPKKTFFEWFSSLFGRKPSFNQFQLQCLNAHNQMRSAHDSPPMKLDKKMCNEAQAWAEELAAKNMMTFDPNPRSYGQNLLCVCNMPVPEDGVAPVRDWYSSVHKYNGRYSNDTASFTQVVWASSFQLGVGIAKSPTGETYVVAHYYPPGNISNQEDVNVKKWKEAQST